MRSANARTISARGALIPQSRAVHIPASSPAISGGVPGLSPGVAPKATTRDRDCLSFIAAILREVLAVSSDPDIGSQ
jgi:hypothetical protein